MKTQNNKLKFIDYIFFLAIGGVFFQRGISKIYNINGVMSWMESYSIPGILIYPSIVLELLAPMMIVLGIKRNLAVIVLMLFCITTASVFHSSLGEPMQLTAFLRNIALCGGFYFVLRMDSGDNKTNDLATGKIDV